jgi:homoserine kinase type II
MHAYPPLSAAVLAQYDLGEIYAVEPQTGGGIDQSYLVICDRGRLFLKRRAPGYSAEMVGCDHALIRFLVRHDFPTPAVVPSQSGSSWVEWEGRVYEAFTYVEGAGFQLGNHQQLTSLGRSMALYHGLVAQYQAPRLKLPPWGSTSVAAYLDLSSYIEPRLGVLLSRRQLSELEAEFVKGATQRLKSQSEKLTQGPDVISLIVHGALEPGNVLFDQAGNVIAWVDWADSARFVRVYDVAHALLKFAGRRPDAVLPGQVGHELSWPSVESLARAYRREIKLTSGERAALPWLMLACRIVDALWVSDAVPVDYRRELRLAAQLHDWLVSNASALLDVFQ